jgi:hypothetical protein
MPRRTVQFNGYHAITEGAIFTGLRASHFEKCDYDVLHRLPTTEDAPRPTSVILGDIWSVHWIRPAAPFMMLVPQNRRPFDSPLFSRLDINTVPVHQNEDRSWSLRSDIIDDWYALELNLHGIWWAMFKQTDATLPKNFCYWAWPHRYGYRWRYRSRSDVNIIAARSRNSFIPLMASITYLIIHLDSLAVRYPDSSCPEWRRDVIAAAKIHPQWFADLESSIVGDLRAPWVGGIVEFAGCQFLNLLPSLRKLNMPLLLHWEPIEHRWGISTEHQLDPIPSWLEPLAPTYSIVEQLRGLERIFTGRTYSPEPNAPAPVFPLVESYSGQRQNEDWRAFFARRAEEGRRRIETETPKQKQARLQRETVPKNTAPGKRGARVYCWEDVNGFRIRKAVDRNKCDLYWDEEDEYRKRFDPVFNEWDICSEFSDSDGDASMKPDNNNDNDNDPDMENRLPLRPEEDLFQELER